MKLSPIILQLIASSTSFGSNIAGAAELAAAKSQTYSVDRAFVVQLVENATPNDQEAGLNQELNEIFAVVVAINNTTDRRGQTAHDNLFGIRAEIFSSILNWTLPGAEAAIEYVSGRLLDMNRAYLWYQFEFSAITRLTDDDGLQIVADPFLHANVKIDIEDEVDRTDGEDDIILPGP